MSVTKPERLTERDVLALLRAKHAKGGNGGGGEYAFLTHVRDAAGFDAKRTIDALAVSLWPSRGLVLDAFEVKVSRSDWQRELAKPHKAEVACRIADRFWIVAPAGSGYGPIPEGTFLVGTICTSRQLGPRAPRPRRSSGDAEPIPPEAAHSCRPSPDRCEVRFGTARMDIPTA